MDRMYSNKKECVEFFIGKEIENTIFKDQNTLFVVGNKQSLDILDKIDKSSIKITHIYFAANHSYDVFSQFDQFLEFISLGYNITYEISTNMICDELLSKLPLSNSKFLLMISVVLPNLEKYKYSATLKIDDVDINRKNPGVYCHDLIKLLKSDNFTSWEEYNNDIII